MNIVDYTDLSDLFDSDIDDDKNMDEIYKKTQSRKEMTQTYERAIYSTGINENGENKKSDNNQQSYGGDVTSTILNLPCIDNIQNISESVTVKFLFIFFIFQ